MTQAPGTLDDDSQRRLMAQVVQLVQEAFGDDAQMAMTVMRWIEGEREGLAIYTMGTTPDPKRLQTMLTLAAKNLKHRTGEMRTLDVHQEPRAKQ